MSEKYIAIPCDFRYDSGDDCIRNISPGTFYYEMEPCGHRFHKCHIQTSNRVCPKCNNKIEKMLTKENLTTKDELGIIKKGGRFTRRKRRSSRRRRTRGRRRH
jgi:predicted nucleic acid-binding Zn ribbon protein